MNKLYSGAAMLTLLLTCGAKISNAEMPSAPADDSYVVIESESYTVTPQEAVQQHQDKTYHSARKHLKHHNERLNSARGHEHHHMKTETTPENADMVIEEEVMETVE